MRSRLLGQATGEGDGESRSDLQEDKLLLYTTSTLMNYSNTIAVFTGTGIERQL